MKDRREEHWFDKHWRPAMGWQYLVVCSFDFVIAPIFMSLLATYNKTPVVPWVPLTLQGGGLYHLAMATVVGVTAYGRTQEKINGINKPTDPTAKPDASAVQPTDPAV